MDVTISKENIKVFAHMITCLSKLGEQLNLEMSSNRNTMTLHTVNSMYSAYVQFTLLQQFFIDYDVRKNRNQKFQLVLKHFMSVFRNLNNIEELRLYVPRANNQDEENDSIEDNMFTIECKTSKGLRRTTKLYYMQVDPMTARYETKDYPVQLRYDSLAMNQCLANFPNSVSEISFILEQRRLPRTGSTPQSQDGTVEKQIRVKSYVNPGSSDVKNMLITQLTIDSSQFDFWRCDIDPPALDTQFEQHTHHHHPTGSIQTAGSHTPNTGPSPQSSGNRSRIISQQPQFKQQLEMTFNLKDFKSFLHFCEHAEQPVTIYMDNQGKPIIFQSSADLNNNDIEAVCVLATLSEENSSQSTSQSSTNTSTTHSATPTQSPARNRARNSRSSRSSVSTFSHSPLVARSSSSRSSGDHPSTNDQMPLSHEEITYVQNITINESNLSATPEKRARAYDEDDDNEDDDRVVEDEANGGSTTPPPAKRSRYSSE